MHFTCLGCQQRDTLMCATLDEPWQLKYKTVTLPFLDTHCIINSKVTSVQTRCITMAAMVVFIDLT